MSLKAWKQVLHNRSHLSQGCSFGSDNGTSSCIKIAGQKNRPFFQWVSTLAMIHKPENLERMFVKRTASTRSRVCGSIQSLIAGTGIKTCPLPVKDRHKSSRGGVTPPLLPP